MNYFLNGTSYVCVCVCVCVCVYVCLCVCPSFISWSTYTYTNTYRHTHTHVRTHTHTYTNKYRHTHTHTHTHTHSGQNFTFIYYQSTYYLSSVYNNVGFFNVAGVYILIHTSHQQYSFFYVLKKKYQKPSNQPFLNRHVLNQPWTRQCQHKTVKAVSCSHITWPDVLLFVP